MSELKSDKLSPRTASGTVVLGTSGDTFEVPSGVTLTNNGTANGFGVSNKVVEVTLGTEQSLTKNVIAKVQFDTRRIDPDEWFDISTNHRFQPDESGYYLFICHLMHGNGMSSTDYMNMYFYKNGSAHASQEWIAHNGYQSSVIGSAIIDMNGSSDYVEIYTRNGANGTLVVDVTEYNASTGRTNRLDIVRMT